jgi:hypothetical protein
MLSTVNGAENVQVSNITKTTDMMLVKDINFIIRVVDGYILDKK